MFGSSTRHASKKVNTGGTRIVARKQIQRHWKTLVWSWLLHLHAESLCGCWDPEPEDVWFRVGLGKPCCFFCCGCCAPAAKKSAAQHKHSYRRSQQTPPPPPGWPAHAPLGSADPSPGRAHSKNIKRASVPGAGGRAESTGAWAGQPGARFVFCCGCAARFFCCCGCVGKFTHSLAARRL